MTPIELLLVTLAGVGAGFINTVAGSGTLITFPTLIALGVPPVTANVSNNNVLPIFPYDAGSTSTSAIAAYDVPVPLTGARAKDIGSTFGLGYDRIGKRIFAAAYFKRFSGFGPGQNGVPLTGTNTTGDDPGAIYVINAVSGGVVTSYTVPGATTNAHAPMLFGETIVSRSTRDRVIEIFRSAERDRRIPIVRPA